MNPPTDYFRRCDAEFPGAQRVGFEWFVFTDTDALSRALSDGMFEPKEDFDCPDCRDKDNEIEELESEKSELQKQVDKLEEELKEARSKK